MEIFWPAAGLCIVGCFLFFILAQHWTRILRHHSWTIRRLSERLRELEEMADPEFRRRLSESSPLPLEQVFTFSFRLDDRFWRDTLYANEEDRRFVQSFGSFVGSVKLERWRSHTVATVTELLPDSKTDGLRARTLDFYPEQTRSNDLLTLWETPLARASLTGDQPPSLELVLRKNSVELYGHRLLRNLHAAGRPDGVNGNGLGGKESVFFRVPLDVDQLAEFRRRDPARDTNREDDHNGIEEMSGNGTSWHAFYSNCNEEIGFEWQLRLRDLSKKAEWERWKILESEPIGFTGDGK